MKLFKRKPTSEERCKLLQLKLDQLQVDNSKLRNMLDDVKATALKNKNALDACAKNYEEIASTLKQKLEDMKAQHIQNDKTISQLSQKIETTRSEKLRLGRSTQLEDFQHMLEQAKMQEDEDFFFVDENQRVWQLIPRNDVKLL